MASSAAPANEPFWIETERLIMRSPRYADSPGVLAMMENPLNMEHEPMHNAPQNTLKEVQERHIADDESNRKGEKALSSIFLKNPDGSEGPLIGMGGYPWVLSNANGRPGNTGVLIDSAYWRKGYASEALIGSLDWGFDTLGFETIEQTTLEANTAYRALMRALGLEPFQERRWSDEMNAYEVNFPVTRAQWQEIKPTLIAKVRAASQT